jgi:hypothetical protein
MRTHCSHVAKKKQPQPRWYQGRLRFLFVLVLLTAIGMSWLAVTIRAQRNQNAVADAIRKVGGVPGCEPTWLGRLLGNESLVSVGSVGLRGESVNESTLVRLHELSQLETVLLKGTNVTDGEVAHLEGLKLRRLWLSETSITDAGLVHLEDLKQLEFLFLNDTQLTDAGLTHLRGLTQLLWLDLQNTKVTDEGVDNLHGALPDCVIRH